MAVNAADHDVQFGQGVVGQIERTVPQNVALDAGEHPDAQPAAIDLANLLGKRHHARLVQAVGHGERFPHSIRAGKRSLTPRRRCR